MKKRIVSFLLLVTLTVVFVLGNFSAAFADPEQNLTSTKGVYWFGTHAVPNDLTDTYIYDDRLLTGDSLEYNPQLATMSYELAVASISSARKDYDEKSCNLKAYLEDNGFIDFDTNDDYKQRMTTQTMGAACAHKQIVDNGQTYTLLAIVPRSAGYEAEWGGNFMMGASRDHEGFKNGREKVLAFAKEYIETYEISGDIKVWTAGYSRGAGVTNQVGAALLADPEQYLGDQVNLEPKNFYCYTFGTPKSAGSPEADFGDPTSETFDYIHNVWESYDVVTTLPPDAFGFTRYGKDFTYADQGDKEKMLAMLKVTNQAVYELYMNGGDPDGFKPLKIDTEALVNKELKFVPDDASYLPYDQSKFLNLMGESLALAADNSRQTYYDVYQTPLQHLFGYYFSHIDQGGDIIGAITKSKFAIPFAAAMYISYMAERYQENTISADDRADLEAMVDEILEEIQAMSDAGEEIPQELIDQLNALAVQLQTAEKLQNIVNLTAGIRSILYQLTIGEGLKAAGLDQEDPELFRQLTSDEEARSVSRILSYLLLYDSKQTEEISFDYLSQQMKHLATFAGNASSYQRPHNNEVILSWLRTLDPNYTDFANDPEIYKENAAQKSGYRRLYIDAPEGVDVSGTVKDDAGNVVATFKNGELLSRTNSWIGITTCDNGNWLRLPADNTFRIELDVSEDTTLNLKAAEYDVETNTEVRTETSDENYNWTGLKVEKENKPTWVISAVEGEGCPMPSSAAYYIEFEKEYTITYNLNNGELDGQTGSISRKYAKNTVITLPTPTRAGYTFDYWEGSRYEAGERYTVTEDHTFTAQWIRNAAPDKGDEGATPVDTGDHSNALLWVVICCFSAILLINLALHLLSARRRSHKH